MQINYLTYLGNINFTARLYKGNRYKRSIANIMFAILLLFSANSLYSKEVVLEYGIETYITDLDESWKDSASFTLKTLNDCEDCEGRVTTLVLSYTGSIADAEIIVKNNNDTVIIFSGIVQPNESFECIGFDNQETLGSQMKFYVNGIENTTMHTSCSESIGPGLVSGDFEVISGESRNGGVLCPLDDSEGVGSKIIADFKAYPVPFRDRVFIKYNFNFETDVLLEVFDVRGVLLKSVVNKNYIKGTNDVTKLDLPEVDDQLLFVKLTTRRGSITKKIISSATSFKE